MPVPRLGPFAVPLLTALVLAGCASPAPLPAPVEAPPAFSASGEAAAPAAWWTAFDDPGLDGVVDEALAQNFDLLAAWERLRAARAVVDRSAAVLRPTLEGFADAEVRRFGEEADEGEDVRLGLAAGYEVDLWGRLRSRVDAERFRAAATAADVQAAALSLSAEIVQTWYRIAEARRQRALIREQVETNLTVLQLIENRFAIGQVRAVDVLRQRQLVEATREQAAVAEARLQVLRHQLAVLRGRAPQRARAEQALPEALPALPPLPAAGVPVALVQRRPDVRSAFLRLRAADRDLASALSSRYPRLTLSAAAATDAPAAGDLFRSWVLTAAGNVLAPIFLGGELEAEVDRSEAVRRERAYAYGQSILVAFREVEDALVREARQRDRLDHLAAQITLAEQAYEQLRVQYFNGAAEYLAVLTALDDVQRLRRDLVAAELTLVETRIALYRALAGPIEPAGDVAG